MAMTFFETIINKLKTHIDIEGNEKDIRSILTYLENRGIIDRLSNKIIVDLVLTIFMTQKHYEKEIDKAFQSGYEAGQHLILNRYSIVEEGIND